MTDLNLLFEVAKEGENPLVGFSHNEPIEGKDLPLDKPLMVYRDSLGSGGFAVSGSVFVLTQCNEDVVKATVLGKRTMDSDVELFNVDIQNNNPDILAVVLEDVKDLDLSFTDLLKEPIEFEDLFIPSSLMCSVKGLVIPIKLNNITTIGLSSDSKGKDFKRYWVQIHSLVGGVIEETLEFYFVSTLKGSIITVSYINKLLYKNTDESHELYPYSESYESLLSICGKEMIKNLVDYAFDNIDFKMIKNGWLNRENISKSLLRKNKEDVRAAAVSLTSSTLGTKELYDLIN